MLYLGYFANLALLGCFLGMGLGLFAARNKRWNLIYTFPVALAVLVGFVLTFETQAVINSPSEVYFTDNLSVGALPPWLVLPIVFVLLVLVHMGPAQEMGRLIRQGKPLASYSLNIVGSLLGIAAFFVASTFSLGAVVWFGAAAILYALVARLRWRYALLVLAFLPAGISGTLDVNAIWSPYYRVEVHAQRPSIKDEPPLYRLSVNNITHQFISHFREREQFYEFPYQLLLTYLQQPPDILVIGSGVGTDTSFALAYGVKSVDAVEIDPVIARIGKALHPDGPYLDKRVNLTIEDGRVFMKRSEKKYDAVLFGLPDSLGLVSSSASVRLESFLFTIESMAEARKLLKPDGVFVLYNYYRAEWLVRRLGVMLEQVFGQHPVILMPPRESQAAVLFAGPGAKYLPEGFGSHFGLKRLELTAEDRAQPLPTDNWPFFYLKAPGIPPIYYVVLLSVLLSTLAGIYLVWPRRSKESLASLPPKWWLLMQGRWHLFMTGVAFMLLETASIVRGSLVLGATWRTNAFVFFFLLLLVLFANLLAQYFRFKRLWILALLLAGSLAAAYLVPLEWALSLGPVYSETAAALLMLSPIFFANLIFASFFRDEEGSADLGMAVNLFGAMCGGMLEYFSLISGYAALYIVAGGLYLGAMLYWYFGRSAAAVFTLESQPDAPALDPDSGSHDRIAA